MVYTDHKNLVQNAQCLTSDQVYCWRLLLEEYVSTIMYVKGIHNTVVDAISPLSDEPITIDRLNWMTFAQCWCYHNSTQEHKKSMAKIKKSMSLMFTN